MLTWTYEHQPGRFQFTQLNCSPTVRAAGIVAARRGDELKTIWPLLFPTSARGFESAPASEWFSSGKVFLERSASEGVRHLLQVDALRAFGSAGGSEENRCASASCRTTSSFQLLTQLVRTRIRQRTVRHRPNCRSPAARIAALTGSTDKSHARFWASRIYSEPAWLRYSNLSKNQALLSLSIKSAMRSIASRVSPVYCSASLRT